MGSTGSPDSRTERYPERGRIGIVADDLTGAADTGLQFFRQGIRTAVIAALPDREAAGTDSAREGVGRSIPHDVEAIAIDAGGRTLDPAHAAHCAARAATWLEELGCRSFYHKVDSTLRGNLASEVGRLLHELDLDLAVIAPAFPEAGRITVGGFQLVGGVPVALSSYGQDPIGPVEESHLPTILRQAGNKTALVDLRTVLAGWERIVGAIAEEAAKGARAIVLDAARPEDLDAIARAIARLGPKVLPVGSAGLARELFGHHTAHRMPRLLNLEPLARDGGGARSASRRVLARTPPVLIVSGSCNPTTLQQIASLGDEARVVTVDVRQLLLTEGASQWGTALHDELESTARQALQGLLAGRNVVVTTASSAEQIARDQALGRDLGLSAWQLGAQLCSALGALACRLMGAAPMSGLIVAGGQTASSVCRALGAEVLEIIGEAYPAIPVLRSVDLDMRLVTKSGGFGSQDALGQIARHLRHEAGLVTP